MVETLRHFETSLAQTVLMVVLGLTTLLGVSATVAYIWHVYRLVVLNG